MPLMLIGTDFGWVGFATGQLDSAEDVNIL